MTTEHVSACDRLLRLKEVVQLTGLSRSTLYRRVADGSFPRPRSLGPNAVAWRLSEVEAWIDELPTTT
ncbi:helix-turn-helix transcriptional regulator [Amorphus sp. MBR-141]